MLAAARSFTDPPGLVHSALASTSTPSELRDALEAQQRSVADSLEQTLPQRFGIGNRYDFAGRLVHGCNSMSASGDRILGRDAVLNQAAEGRAAAAALVASPPQLWLRKSATSLRFALPASSKEWHGTSKSR